MRSIVVIHTGGIGDFLQTLPVLEALRLKWPGATVTIIGHPERGELARLGGLADEVADFETSGCHRLFAPDAEPQAAPRTLVAADLILNFLPHEIFNAGLSRITRGRVVAVRSFPTAGECRKPVAQFVYDQVSSKLGLPATVAVPHLRVQCKERAEQRVAAIHPGSGASEKNWPADRFRELAARLSDRGLTVRWILGPAEEDSATLRAMAATEDCMAHRRLTDLARLLASVQLYVGNDSGITHLAAAVAAPTVALFGPSEAAVWGPRGKNVRVVRSTTGHMADLSVNEATNGVEGLLG
ncbi:MAG: glycosyltransferase family 9 protein [Planctomycetes bacterium]|nr:glycosyltransferase family 9 protein [Planctomycetota bacterium]